MYAMNCHKCTERAVLRMRHHRLSLCKTHYIEWFTAQTERAIKKYQMFTHNERVLVAVSGGKDSLALWDVLTELGYAAEGLYIHLGIEGETHYSDQSQEYAQDFANRRNLSLRVVNVAESYGESIPDLTRRSQRGKSKPCAVCGLTKRHVMNRITRDLGFDVLATAHNLDDEVAVLMGNVMSWNTAQLARQSPTLDAAPGLARKVKPFCRFYERETAAYTLLRDIPFIEEECPFAEGSKQLYYKEILNRLEQDQPGTKLAFYVQFLQARQAGAFPVTTEDQPLALFTCPSCGQPTLFEGTCAFCKMMKIQPPTSKESPVESVDE